MWSLIDLSRYFHLRMKNRKPQRAEERYHIRCHLRKNAHQILIMVKGEWNVALSSESTVGKRQCFCGVKDVLVQVPIAYLVLVTVTLKYLLILYVKHRKQLQHFDHAEMGLEKIFGVLFCFIFFWFFFFWGGEFKIHEIQQIFFCSFVK